MCLAVPAKIISIKDEEAVVDIDGIRRSINIALVDNVQVDDYVIIHAGFAIHKWTSHDVQEFQALRATLNQDNHDRDNS